MTTVEWAQCEPGIAVIRCMGGSVDDRWLAEVVTREELAACGIRQARFSFDAQKSHESSRLEKQFWRSDDDSGLIPVQRLHQKNASWDDIMAKAKRLLQSGNVQLLRNGYNIIVAHVIGDHGEYTSEISRDDPNSRAITQWTCECPWDQYAFQRTRQWKKYEGRPCAHVLAAFWKSQATPLDEDAPPGATPSGPAVPQTPEGGPGVPMSPFQPRLPVRGQPGPDGGMMPGLPPASQGQFGPPNLPPPSVLPPVGNPPMQGQMPIPFAPPGQNGIIPPFPMDPAQLQLPVSVPGGRPGPYPANPMQQPGTFSKFIRAVDDWPIKVVELEGQTGGNHDKIWPVGHGYPTRPVAYHPDQRRIYMGPEGAYHNDVGIEPGSMALGRLTKDGYVDWYGSDKEPWVPEVNQVLGAQSIRKQPIEPEWDDGLWEDEYEWPKFAGANDKFQPNQSARLNEATLGQSEGCEGATDAGQWMEIPRNARVEVVHQDPTTGWVEIMYPLKGGPMTSYHVRCFVEPEKLTPMEGDSPMAPRRRSSTNVQVHTPESVGKPSMGGNVVSAPMIYDEAADTLHVGSEDDIHHADMWPHIQGHGYAGYISYEAWKRGGKPGYQWYDRPPNAAQLHEAILGHMGTPDAIDLDTVDPPHLDW